MSNRLLDRRAGLTIVAMSLTAAALGSCVPGRPLDARAGVRNGSVASEVTAREHAGGSDEGPLGRQAALSRSYLYGELAREGIRPERLGPLDQIHDRRTLMAVMNSFTRGLGVRCEFCHMPGNFAAPTARKAAAAYMWDQFVAKLEFHDGSPLYCDSCHHETNIFLRRQLTHRAGLLRYMREEYVELLQRRDGASHNCGTCHGAPFNFRFLPRHGDPPGYHPPPAQPGPRG